MADPFEDFQAGSESRWEFIADGVMGGVSQGEAKVSVVEGAPAITLSGLVSTANNGGFIQARRKLTNGLPNETKGLRIESRGNGEIYYVFLRTREMTRPWYYYSASFIAGQNWSTAELALDQFAVSHSHLAKFPAPDEIISIGLVAYGRDHKANLIVRNITLF